METMRDDVSEMKNVSTIKSWPNVCGGDSISTHGINQQLNWESIVV